MADVSSGSPGQEKKTLIEEGTSFKGSVSSSCPITVRGRIEGDLQAPSLAISPSGAVHGRVRVGAATSEGEIAGEFDADSVELSGTVRDDTVIRARTLRVQLSATEGKMQVLFGNCELHVGDDPSLIPPPKRKGKGEGPTEGEKAGDGSG